MVRAHPTVPLQKIPLWFQQRTDRPNVFARAKYKRRIQMALRMVALVRAKDGSWFARKPNKDIDAGPWCEGFYAAMKLRLSAWAPLRNLADINHGLLLPILFHCVDDQERPMLGPPRKGPETEKFSRIAYKDIPAVVEEMRQYWMPTRFKTRS